MNSYKLTCKAVLELSMIFYYSRRCFATELYLLTKMSLHSSLLHYWCVKMFLNIGNEFSQNAGPKCYTWHSLRCPLQFCVVI